MVRMLFTLLLTTCLYAEDILHKNDDGIVTIHITREMFEHLPVDKSAMKTDENLPNWAPQMPQKDGLILTVGSDYLNNMSTLWATTFRETYPKVDFQIEGQGGSTAMPPLIAEIQLIGAMSRLPHEKEITAFYEAHPNRYMVALPVAYNALGLFVHKDNPVSVLSVEHIRGIFALQKNG